MTETVEEVNYCHDRETGAKIAHGSVWYDGCRKCLCFKGVEYCSLISCKKLTSCRSNSHNTNNIALSMQWLSTLKKPNTCCPVCPFSATNGKKLTRIGSIILIAVNYNKHV